MEAYPYVHLADARQKIASKHLLGRAPLSGREFSVLDVGTGEGLFAIAIAKRCSQARIRGIDPIEPFVRTATGFRNELGLQNRVDFIVTNLVGAIQADSLFDFVVTFLSVCELMNGARLNDICRSLRQVTCDGGHLILCEAFPELSTDPREHLGYDLHRAVGYEYCSLAECGRALEQSNFHIETTESYETGAAPVALQDIAEFLLRESRMNAAHSPDRKSASRVLEELSPNIKDALGEAIFDPRITAIMAKAV